QAALAGLVLGSFTTCTPGRVWYVMHRVYAVAPLHKMRRMGAAAHSQAMSVGVTLRMVASCAPVMVHCCTVSHRARPWAHTRAVFSSTVRGTSAPSSPAKSGQKRVRGWP